MGLGVPERGDNLQLTAGLKRILGGGYIESVFSQCCAGMVSSSPVVPLVVWGGTEAL